MDLVRLGVIALLLIFFWVIPSCAPEGFKVQLDAEDRYELATKYLEKGNYNRAIAQFKAIILNFPGSALVDDAGFGLAEAYFRSKDYHSALNEYKRLLQDFPLSEYADDAQYKLGLCYFRLSLPAELDQENTYRAIEEFQKFLEYYPESEWVPEAGQKIYECRTKLAEKAFKNGHLYLKLKYYDAALLSLQSVLNEYEDTEWAAWAQLDIGEVYYRQGKYGLALEAFLKVIADYGDNEQVADKAKEKLEALRKRLKTANQVGAVSWRKGGKGPRLGYSEVPSTLYTWGIS